MNPYSLPAPKNNRLHLLIRSLVCLAVFAQASALAQPLEPVTLQLKWKHQFQFAGYYVAIEKGFYREAGLEVTLREAESGKPYVDPVLNGEVEFGVAASELAVLRAQGKPVIALAPIYQHSPLVIIASTRAGIDNVHELAGKRVMIAPEEAELFAYLKAEGIAPEVLEFVQHDYSIASLTEGRIDALSGYSTDEPFDLDAAGFPYVMFRPRSGGIDFYADTLFTTEAQIQSHPGRVRRFVDASLRGWRYAFENTEEAVALVHAKYAPNHSIEHLRFEAEESRRLIQPDLVEIGYTNPGRWRDIAETYAELQIIPHSADITGLIYNRDPTPDLRWLVSALALSMLGMAAIASLAGYFYRLNAVNQRQALELRRALDEVNALRGIIPICSYCKKIRDDQGAWQDLEHYIASHSDAEFSHGICTDCYGKVRTELDATRLARAAAEGTSDPTC